MYLHPLDLTDESKLIISGGKRGAAVRDSYRIHDNIIRSSTLMFRIVEVTVDTLTLRLILDIQHAKTSLAGEVMELKFTQMKTGEEN